MVIKGTPDELEYVLRMLMDMSKKHSKEIR